jgi:hypothetical protein
MSEVGSPLTLSAFARWCRYEIDATLANDEAPALVVANSPEYPEPLTVGWRLNGEPPTIEELIVKLVPAWIAETMASQLGLAIPCGRPRPGVTLVALDEAEALIEHAYLDLGRLRLGSWQELATEIDTSAWQTDLARNAGWDELAKWRCRRCGSVCAGEAASTPSPCEFCAATEIERVPLNTPLRAPDPAFSPFLQALRAIIDRQRP